MKKTAFILCSIFIFSSLSYAMPGNHNLKGNDSAEDKKARDEKMMILKKDFIEYHKNLENLIDEYNKADNKKKEEILKDIKALVYEQTDKDVAKKKEMLAIQKERITKFEEKISEIEADKEAYVNKKVAFYISSEGIQKIKEKSMGMKEKETGIEKNKGIKDKKGKKNRGEEEIISSASNAGEKSAD